MRLSTGEGVELTNPSSDQVRDVLASLRAEDFSFAAYEREDGYFVQAAGDAEGGFRVEYHDGSTNQHYVASGFPSLEDTLALFEALKAGESLETMQDWQREASDPVGVAPSPLDDPLGGSDPLARQEGTSPPAAMPRVVTWIWVWLWIVIIGGSLLIGIMLFWD